MRTIEKWRLTAQLTATIVCCGAIKMFYSTASVNDLMWILAPTTVLVELATGMPFTFESYSGYMSADHSFLIAASCSGVNFMITAFLMLVLSRLWKRSGQDMRWTFIAVSLAMAYLTTIVANTVRIVVAMFIRRADPEVIWLNPEDLHRFEGIAVYFGFLMLLYVVAEKLNPDARPSESGLAGLLRRSLLPLGIYYATTIGVPLANSAFRRGPSAVQFWSHSILVLITPIFLLAILASFSFVKGRQAARGLKDLDRTAAAGT